ncbi:MAG: N-acetylmuramoyl-L-alanine amidase [Nevskiales bacterium]
MRKICLLLAMLVAPSVAHANERVDDIRIWAAPDNTRVVLDLSGPVPHNVFAVDGPDRVVIDVADIRLRGKQYQKKDGKGLIKGIRTAPRFGDDTRVVLDLHGPVEFSSFALKPNAEYGHRLVIDIKDARPPEVAARFAKEIEAANRREYPVLLDDEPLDAPVLASADTSADVKPLTEEEPPALTEPDPGIMSSGSFAPRLKVVAIDAGHGGEDPGARGPTGLKEKHVALDIAKRLASMLNKQPGMKAVLVRDGDYYIGLRDRAEKARKHDADLFVSIHADAFTRRSAKGASVYVLSRRGASSEHARWLAERENGADLVGGVSIKDKDDTLAAVMLDLAQNAALEASFDVGARVLRELGQIGNVHKKTVQQAGFVVLKSPDIPSILVETAFISNYGEEKKLRSSKYKDKLAKAVMGGIEGYFSSYRPNETVASR